MVNTTKIKARMVELELNQTGVAAEMGIAQSTFNQKINNTRPMSLDEAEILQRILKVADADFGEYFFSRRVA